MLTFSNIPVYLFRDGEEALGLGPNEKSDPKEKSLANRRVNRHHPYKNGGVGDKKGAQRNRVFISNIPYDMKWQAIKDLMREKGNHACAKDGPFSSYCTSFFLIRLIALLIVIRRS